MSRITLTIDNGPHPKVTPQVLQVLADKGVKAYFFVVGRQAERFPALLDDTVAAGHVIGNHTWSHQTPFGENTDLDAVDKEVIRTREILKDYMTSPPLFRPFGGGGRLDACLFSPALIDHLCTEGYTCVLWNNVPRDWEDMDGWVETALTTAAEQPESVLVVHDILPGNAARVAQFIDEARAAGHTFVDEIASECLPIVGGEVRQDLAAWTTAV